MANLTGTALQVALVLTSLIAFTLAYPRDQRRCLRPCPMNFDPVCDNEGTTHPNLCLMDVVACRRRVELHMVYKGVCRTSRPPAPAVTAKPPRRSLLGRVISLFRSAGKSSEECHYICPLSYLPVCASDGHTYPNECTMKSRACTQQTTLNVEHDGPCNTWALR